MQNFMKTLVSSLKLWTKKEIKNSAADWNQNDSTADNYVKNRTHWEETRTITLVDNLTSEDYHNGNNVPKCNFVPEQKYNVVWNGVSYEGLVCHFDGEYNIIATPDNGYPFYIDDDGGNGLFIEGSSEDEVFTISISTSETLVHKIDEKYLPELPSTPDWNQNDSDGEGYIKNRPFYKLDSTLLGTLQFTATGSNTMTYTYTNDDIDTFSGIEKLSGKGEVLRASIDNHNVIFSVDFSNGRFFSNSAFEGYMYWSEGNTWDVTITSDVISLVDGNIYNVEIYDMIPRYITLDVGYLPEEAHTTLNAPIQVGANLFSTVQGYDTEASGQASHAEGTGTIASGQSSHAEGSSTTASGDYSHAGGYRTIASGNNSHAEGRYTEANHYGMHVFGEYNRCDETNYSEFVSDKTAYFYSTNQYYCADTYTFDSSTGKYSLNNPELCSGVSIGKYVSKSAASDLTSIDKIISSTDKANKYNIESHISSDHQYKRGKYVHMVGNGTSDTARSNAHTLDWNGVGWYQGGLQVGGNAQDDGARNVLLEGDAIPTPTTATVGQTIIVKSVDESGEPAEWECAELPKISKSYFTLTDHTTGEDYVVYMNNGSLVSELKSEASIDLDEE